jgi:hypothetical protein
MGTFMQTWKAIASRRNDRGQLRELLGYRGRW